MTQEAVKTNKGKKDSNKGKNGKSNGQRQVEYRWRPLFDDTSEIKKIALAKAR